jgi:hypothetical protein
MKATYIEPFRTPIPFAQARDCMRWALKSQLDGMAPKDEVLALALAKTALETGRWTQIWCDNWGNVKAADSYVGMYTCITLNEVIRRKNGQNMVVWFAPEGELTGAHGQLIASPIAVPQGHPQTRMRAFANAFDGVDSYVDFVANGRYVEAWKRLLAGDAVGYVHCLKAKGYFTADEAVYCKGVASLQREYLARLRSEAPPERVDIDWIALRDLVPSLQFSADQLRTDNDFEERIA